MNAPDELVAIIHCPEAFDHGPRSSNVNAVYAARIADAILAAGYRKPRTITTAEELDALTDGSAVLDADADISTKHGGRWHGYEMSPLDSRKFSKCGPFAVLHEPEAKL